MRHICRACGKETFTSENLALEFCTNCGTPIAAHAPKSARGSKLSGGEKTAIGFLILIPVLLIFAGIAGIGFFVYKASRLDGPVRRYPTPRPYASPSPQPPSNLLLSFGKEGLGQGEFKNPESIAVDRQGNIYVGDGTLRVQKFDADGKFLMLWNVTESTIKPDERFSNTVTHLAIDGKNRVYVVVEGREMLRYEGESGKFIDRIELYGEKWVDQPQRASVMDIVMLNDDNLAVLAYSFPEGEYVIKVSPEGKSEIKQKDLLKKQNPRSLRLTRGSMLIGVTGEIFLMNNQPLSEKPFIYRFNSDGGYIDRFTWEGAPSVTIFSSKIIALNSKGEVYAYDSSRKTIRVLNVEGVSQRSIPVVTGYMKKMVLDANDNIYILDRDRIEKYSS